MGIPKKWSRYTKENVLSIKDVFGVYEIADRNRRILYIGQGKLRTRLLRHFIDGPDPIPGAAYFRVLELYSKMRAEQKERRLLKDFKRRHGKLPRYNQRVG